MGSPLNITEITATGDFGETNTCNASLATGSSCQISVTFKPTTAGNRAGSIMIADNALGSPQTVALSGTSIDFSLGAVSGFPTSQTISAGQSAKFELAVAALGSFPENVNVICQLSPGAAVSPPTCSLSPSALQVDGNGIRLGGVDVTVDTTAPVTTGSVSHVDFTPGAIPMTWTVLLLGSGWLLLRNRKRLPSLAAPLIVLALASWVGCGGGSSSSHTPGTPAGTYTATITATTTIPSTSVSVSHNMNLTVVVQ